MPISKKLNDEIKGNGISEDLSLKVRERVANFLGIGLSRVYVTGNKKLTLRIWTKDTTSEELDNIRSKRNEIKAIVQTFGVEKVALSEKDPKNAAYAEAIRVRMRSSEYKKRNAGKVKSRHGLRSSNELKKILFLKLYQT